MEYAQNFNAVALAHLRFGSTVFAVSSILFSPGVFAAENSPYCQKGLDDYMQPAIAKLTPPKIEQEISHCTDTSNLDESMGSLADFMTGLERQQFPPQCVFEALSKRIGPGGGILYGACDSPSSKIRTTRKCNGPDDAAQWAMDPKHPNECSLEKPCDSPEYAALVYDGFVKSTKCLGIDPAEIFPVFGLESSFQINIGNSGGDWGIGQVSPPALRTQDWGPVFANLRNKSACQDIRDKLVPMSPNATACERVALPYNPVRSFVYGELLYLGNRDIARAVTNSFKQKLLKAGQPSPSPEFLEQLSTNLTWSMYNGGAGVVRQAFNSFLEEPGSLQLDSSSFWPTFAQYMSAHLGEGIKQIEEKPELQKQMRRTVPLYARYCNNYSKGIEQRANAKCSQ